MAEEERSGEGEGGEPIETIQWNKAERRLQGERRDRAEHAGAEREEHITHTQSRENRNTGRVQRVTAQYAPQRGTREPDPKCFRESEG